MKYLFGFVSIFISGFIITGCGSIHGPWISPEYQAKVLKYGDGTHHVDEILKIWGVPTATVKTSDGGSIIEYHTYSKGYVPPPPKFSPTTTYQRGTVSGGGVSGTYSGTSKTYGGTRGRGRTIDLHCKTTFIVLPNGMVHDRLAVGNQCR